MSNKLSSDLPKSIDWAQVRKEVGNHCKRRHDYKKANKNFQRSLKTNSKKLDSVYLVANSFAREANLDQALKLLDEKSKLECFKDHFKCNLQKCDCNYEKNLFEKNLLLVSDKTRQCKDALAVIPKTTRSAFERQKDNLKKGPKVSQLQARFETTRTNFDEMIDKKAGNCLFEQRKYFDKIMHTWKPDEALKKPLIKSKVLSKSTDCDVVSIFEENVLKKSVNAEYQLEHLKRKFAQCYMQSAWEDFAFMNTLKANKILTVSNQNEKSFGAINQEIDECVEKTGNFISQLHARCPLYTYANKMFPVPRQKEKAERTNKYRSQYETRRQMFLNLEAILECRKEGNLKKLIKLAEHELGVHHQIKTKKVMPRKIEFATEICNLIGLAHVDKLKKPNFHKKGLELLASILDVSLADKYAVVPYIFGEQSTYRDPGKPDTSYLDFKTNVDRIERRLKYSSLPIEKCHLFHEMGKQNLTQTNFEETRSIAQKIINEARDAKSFLWEFLGQIMFCRVDVKQKSVVRVNESLKNSLKTVEAFGDEELKEVIEEALQVSEDLL